MGITVGVGATRFGSIAGGFVRVDVAELAHAWHACRSRPLGIGDFRAWLALREMVERRRGGGGGGGPVRSPGFGLAELARLLDVAERTAAAAVRRLVQAGLLAWSPSAITFAAPPHRDFLPADLADTISGGQGSVFVPRRMVRFLARGGRPALIATALAALLRCVARRQAGFAALGRFKASWIASRFAISERHAKAARAQLVALGWLQPQPGDQWALNRWGRAYLVRLDWAGPGGDRHPHPAPAGAGLSPPDLHPDPLREAEHPEPARGGPAGASLAETGTDRSATIAEPPPSPPVKSALPVPDLRDIRAEDLADPVRALALHRQAVERGRITASEQDRVRFLAAVEHARGVGTVNPPGLLARVVARGWWHLLTLGDEDRAVRRRRGHDRPPVPAAPAGACGPPAPAPAPAPAPVPAPAPAIRSPYAAETTVREPSSLADVLARLAVPPGNPGGPGTRPGTSSPPS